MRRGTMRTWTHFKDLKQEFANDGFKGVAPPDTAKKELENETQAFAAPDFSRG